MRALFLITLFLLVGLFSCKKHRLRNDREAIKGRWEWIYSVRLTSSNSPGQTYKDTLFPSDVMLSHEVEFQKNGKVFFLENDEEKDNFRVVFNKFQKPGGNPSIFEGNGELYEFSVWLDNNSQNSIYGYLSSDSLMYIGSDFPFQNETTAAYNTTHLNYFKRIE